MGHNYIAKERANCFLIFPPLNNEKTRFRSRQSGEFQERKRGLRQKEIARENAIHGSAFARSVYFVNRNNDGAPAHRRRKCPIIKE